MTIPRHWPADWRSTTVWIAKHGDELYRIDRG
jgi:hypothetical protein